MKTAIIFSALFIFNMSVFALLSCFGASVPPRPRLARSLTLSQMLNAVTNAPEGVEIRVPVTPYVEWREGYDYSAGDIATVDGAVFVCLKPHTAEVSSAPAASTNLWRAIRQQRRKHP